MHYYYHTDTLHLSYNHEEENLFLYNITLFLTPYASTTIFLLHPVDSRWS